MKALQQRKKTIVKIAICKSCIMHCSHHAHTQIMQCKIITSAATAYSSKPTRARNIRRKTEVRSVYSAHCSSPPGQSLSLLPPTLQHTYATAAYAECKKNALNTTVAPDLGMRPRELCALARCLGMQMEVHRCPHPYTLPNYTWYLCLNWCNCSFFLRYVLL